MGELSAKEQYFLILADIAMAAAIKTYDGDYRIAADGENYVPGSIRDAWLERTADSGLRRRVVAMANAGSASLQALPAPQLAATAEAHGVPLAAGMAERMAQYFDSKRNAVLTYNR